MPVGGFGTPPPGPWVDPAYGTVTTPFVKLPRFVELQCVGRNGPLLPPELTGIHLLDFTIQMGDLVKLARIQGFVHLLTHLV
jgi:hypothetical protein